MSDDEFRVGAKVSARCKGSQQYYPGKIKRDNGIGTAMNAVTLTDLFRR